MRPLIQQLVDQGLGRQATVLVVGAGNGTDLPLLRRLEAGRLILIEPHPEQAEALSRRINPAQGEEVWSAAITAEQAGQACLHVVNNPGFSSLKVPTGLLDYFPSLREVRQANVSVRSLSEVIEALSLDRSVDHVLVFDAPGQACDVLSATPIQALQAFARMVVRCSVEPLYDGDKGVDEVLGMLRECGFDPGMEDPEAIYPQTAVLTTRNDARAEKLRLETMLAQAMDDQEAQRQLVNQHAQEIEQLARDRDRAAALAQDCKLELEKANLTASEQQELLASRDAQVEKLVQERDAQTKLAAERAAELEKANQVAAEHQKLVQERDAQTKLAAERAAELEKANQVAAEHQKLVASRDAQVEKLVQERDAQTKLAAERGAELEKANQTAAERQKLVASRDAQIEELTKERDVQAKLVVERQGLLDKASIQNQERGARIIELEREQARLDRHQAWLDQEVVKAEAQVDLIKDVLLREKTL